MSALSERLQEDLKAAMKAGDTVARASLRMTIAALKNRRIEVGEDLDEGEELAVIGKEVKKRQDSATQYADAGREDLAANETAEIEVLKRYLPEELTEEETRELVRKTIEELGVDSKKDLGRVMKAILGEHRGRVDGKLVSRLAGELLG